MSKSTDKHKTTAKRIPLGRKVIIDKAIELVDRDGLDALSMRTLARALNAEAMSLYPHIESRQRLLSDILDQVIDDMAADPEMLLRPDDDWEHYLCRVARAVRRMALVHPKVLPLMISQPRAAPWVRPPLRSLHWVEAFLSGLREQGLPADDAVRIYRSFAAFLIGHLLLEVSSAGVELVPTADEEEQPTGPDLGSYPNLLELAPLLARVDYTSDFEHALGQYIAGLGRNGGQQNRSPEP